MKKTKEELLQKYAEPDCQVMPLVQVDGWNIDYWDEVIGPDGDGDGLIAGITEELRRSPEELRVRVQIVEGTSKETAIRILRKIVSWLERDYEDITSMRT